MQPGDRVRCLIDWHKTLVKGRVYTVRKTRDANLQPPADPQRPDEILIRSKPKEPPGCRDWWYPAEYFQVRKQT